MYILKCELKKIASLPMLWLFLLLCLILNIGIIEAYRYSNVDYSFFSFVKDTAAITGTELGGEFSERLAGLQDSAEKQRLYEETLGVKNIYENLKAVDLGEGYISVYGLPDSWAELMKNKYTYLQHSIDELARSNAGCSLYAAGESKNLHDLLFSVLFRTITGEACLLAVLYMIFLYGYEYQNKTEALIYATYTGRNIRFGKLGAGLLSGCLGYGSLATVTLTVYFMVFDYSRMWKCSVSSCFNYVTEIIGRKPFLTWIPFTLREYLLVILGLGLVLTLIFGLIGAVIGRFCKNSYLGVILFFLLALAMMTAPYFFAEAGLWGGYFGSQFLPVCLWFYSSGWLTDMGIISLIPFHETAGLLGNVIIWGILTAISGWHFSRKDVLS